MNQYDISEFPSEVMDEICYYVYRLIDPRNGETFYVGKGKGNRVFQHMKLALRKEESDEVNDKLQTIRDIQNAGLNVIHVIHRHGLDESTAFEVEAAIIDAYPGLTNLSGGSGSNEYGPMNALEIVNKYKSEEAVLSHRVVMIIINRSIETNDIYNATRFAWKINRKKAEKADYILSIKQGIIVGVYIAKEWKAATIENFPEFHKTVDGRFAFTGVEATKDIKDLYMIKRIPVSYRKKGAANPIKYNY
jgi:uncharacterized protein